MENLTYALPAVMVVGMIIFYIVYFMRIRKAGGMKEAGRKYWREQFGLAPDESVIAMGIGTFYIGPLVPETARSTGGQVLDVLTGTSWRGANVFIGFSDKGRFAVAVEGTEDGPDTVKNSIGLADIGYGVLGVWGPNPRLRLDRAAEAWPGHKHLPKPGKCPKRPNLKGKSVRQELVRLITPEGRVLAIFLEPDWIGPLRTWCEGGPVSADPAFVS